MNVAEKLKIMYTVSVELCLDGSITFLTLVHRINGYRIGIGTPYKRYRYCIGNGHSLYCVRSISTVYMIFDVQRTTSHRFNAGYCQCCQRDILNYSARHVIKCDFILPRENGGVRSGTN